MDGLPQHLWPLSRAGAPVSRHRVHRAGRLALGCPAVAEVSGELRPSAVEGRTRRLGAPPLPLARSGRDPRGLARLELRRSLASPLRTTDLSRASLSTVTRRPRPETRSTTTVASSTSTRSTPRTGRVGGARTASSRAGRTGRSVTASFHIPALPTSGFPPATARATGSQCPAPASRRMSSGRGRVSRATTRRTRSTSSSRRT